jgi:hypothetical protein
MMTAAVTANTVTIIRVAIINVVSIKAFVFFAYMTTLEVIRHPHQSQTMIQVLRNKEHKH